MYDVCGLVKRRVWNDRAIEIAAMMVSIANGEDKQIEWPPRCRGVLWKHFLDLRTRHQCGGRIIDGPELVDSAFLDSDCVGNLDG